MSLRGLQQLCQSIIFMHRQEDSLEAFVVWMHIWSRLHDPPQLYSLAHIPKGLMEHSIEVIRLRLEVKLPQQCHDAAAAGIFYCRPVTK